MADVRSIELAVKAGGFTLADLFERTDFFIFLSNER